MAGNRSYLILGAASVIGNELGYHTGQNDGTSKIELDTEETWYSAIPKLFEYCIY